MKRASPKIRSMRLRAIWFCTISISFLIMWLARKARSSIVIVFFRRYSAPYRVRWRNPERYRTASRRDLLGMVPVLVQTPPTTSLRSMMPTFLPKLGGLDRSLLASGPCPYDEKIVMGHQVSCLLRLRFRFQPEQFEAPSSKFQNLERRISDILALASTSAFLRPSLR